MSKVKFLWKKLKEGKNIEDMLGPFLTCTWIVASVSSGLIWGFEVAMVIMMSPLILLLGFAALALASAPIWIPIIWILDTLDEYEEPPKPAEIEPDPFEEEKNRLSSKQ